MPSPSRLPCAMATFISRPVSSAAPKRPSGSTASTSSLVWPAMAISKSWIEAAPFMTNALIQPRRIRSSSTSPRPHLITCPPMPRRIARFFAPRPPQRLHHAAKRIAGENPGQGGHPAGQAFALAIEPAKSSTRTLPPRASMGTVFSPSKEIG